MKHKGKVILHPVKKRVITQAMRAMGFTGIIIGLTGNAFEQEIADYIAQGANAVLTKPLVLAHLFETLRQIDAESKV